jgi:hypothetical protein
MLKIFTQYLSRFRRRRSSRAGKRRLATQRRLSLEALEDRVVPALGSGPAWALPAAGQAVAVATDAIGDVYVAENTAGAVHGSIAKYDSTGTLLWSQALGASSWDKIDALATDASGNVYATGQFNGILNNQSSPPGGAVFIEELDGGDHHVIWTNSIHLALPWPMNAIEEGHGIAVDSSGNVYVTGEFTGTATFDGGVASIISGGSGQQVSGFAAKLDGTGTFVWADAIGLAESRIDRAAGIAIGVDGLGHVYVAGDFTGTVIFDPAGNAPLTSAGGGSAFLTELDGNGNFISNQQIGGNNTVQVHGLAVNRSGDVYLTGIETIAGNRDLFVAKYEAGGFMAWWKDIGGGNNAGLGMTMDNAGNVYVTGRFSGTASFQAGVGVTSSSSINDAFVAKLDSNGNFVWVADMGAVDAASFSEGLGIAADGLGRIYSTGWFGGTVNFNPIAGQAFDLSAATTPPGNYLSELFDTGALTYTSTDPFGGSQTLRLNGTNLEVVDNVTGSVLARRALAATTNVSISATAWLDDLTIDYSGGSFLPPGGIQFNPAATRFNSLILKGNTTFNGETYASTGSFSGTITFAQGPTNISLFPPPAIAYTNVSSIYDTAAVIGYLWGRWFFPGSMTVNVPAATNLNVTKGNVTNGAVVNNYTTTEIATTGSTVSMPALYFANKPSVIVYGSSGAKTITLNDSKPAAGLTSLTINAGGSSNIIYVFSTGTGTQTTINAGSGKDAIMVGSVSSVTGTLNGIKGTLTINGGGIGSGDTLRIRDEYLAPGQTGFGYSIYSNRISRKGVAAINYNNVQNLELDADNGNNLFDVYSTAAGMRFSIYAGTGTDTLVYPNGLGGVLSKVIFVRLAR